MVHVKVKNVRHRYEGNAWDTPAEISFEVPPGGIALLTGPNGAGKTTLLMRIVGLLRGPGEIEVGHVLVNPRTVHTVRAQTGLLWQDPDDFFLMPTVLEDVALGPLNDGLKQSEALQIAAYWLDRLGIGHLGQKQIQHLSRGERQVVALAGVLARQPRLLLLDEPFSALDEAMKFRVAEVLQSFKATRLIVSQEAPEFHRAWAPDAQVIEIRAG